MTHLESKTGDTALTFTCSNNVIGEFDTETGEINFSVQLTESQGERGGDLVGTVIDETDYYLFGNMYTVALYSSDN